MTLLRARLPWILAALFLVACGKVDGSATSDSLERSSDNDTKRWVSVPVSPEPKGPVDDDPTFVPVSIKVPYPSTASSADDYGGTSSSSSSGSSGSSSGSSGAYPPPPGGEPVGFMSNDIDNPEIATVCADRAAAKGSFSFTPAAPGIDETARVSITRDLTEHRWGDGIYKTKFTLFFRSGGVTIDPQYGRTRYETVSWLDVHLESSTSQPNAFTLDEPQPVNIGWGDGDNRYACGRDGYSTYWSDAEALPYQKAVVTLTRRDGAGVAGTIDIEGGKQTLTFDAPFGEAYPGEDGICCLK